MPEKFDTDVLIAGAGPSALVLATLLGQRGITVRVVEQRRDIIDYPRGVGLDDESYRTFQQMDLVEETLPFTIPHHVMRIVDANGNVIMTNNPQGEPFGWPRKFGFLQPLIDNAVYHGLSRFDNVTVEFNRELTNIEEIDGGVRVTVKHVTHEEGTIYHEDAIEHEYDGESQITARYLVGCEGGRSFTRKYLTKEFTGVTRPTRWVVIDVNNDPLGAPNVYLGADPSRPYVSIGLPRGVRRFEYMLFDDEPTERVEDDDFVESLIHDHLPEGTKLDIIRRRVFVHHGRVSDVFRRGHIMIAGDAAHLMPVWLGQGFNSGVRDVTNLAWKLALIVKGLAGDDLLDTYDVERRDHAKAMVDLSLTFEDLIGPTNKKIAFLRDQAAKVVNLSPQARNFFSDMKFKPMPRYGRGAVVDQETLEPGTAYKNNTRKKVARIFTARNAVEKKSPVGSMFIQPRVNEAPGVRMDDVIGREFNFIAWGQDPARFFTDEQRAEFKKAGVTLVACVSPTQTDWAKETFDADTVVVSDLTGELKKWFDKYAIGIVLTRPDKFVAFAGFTADAGKGWEAFKKAASLAV